MDFFFWGGGGDFWATYDRQSSDQAMDFQIFKKKICESKVLRLLPNVCDFQKEDHTLGYGFKNL
jgi:hypothetical protein